MKGFSLGEVLLSLFVLTVGLIALVSLFQGSLRHSLDTQNAIIATELAQEGVELVRNVRDNDFAIGGDGFPSSSFSTVYHNGRISVNNTDISYASQAPNNDTNRTSGDPYALGYVDNMYKHGAGISARFARYIYINYTDTVGNKNANVTSFVYWGDVPTNIGSGTTTNCTMKNKCVFTQVVLKSWK